MGGGESAFGTRAATTAKKATVVLAVVFIMLTIALGYARRPERGEVGTEPGAPVMPTPMPSASESTPPASVPAAPVETPTPPASVPSVPESTPGK
jgi:hypothetical protein